MAATRLSRSKKLLFMAVLVFFGVAAAAVVGEVYLRLTSAKVSDRAAGGLPGQTLVASKPDCLVRYTDQGRRLKPNARVTVVNHWLSRKDVPIRINSLGFRGPEVAVPKPEGVFRILFLGDSITWANYLLEDETWVAVAGRALSRAFPGRTIEVVNAGVEDTGLADQLAILEESGLLVEPDLVVVAFYENDSRPPWGFPGELGTPGWLRRHSMLADALYRELRFRKWVKDKGADRFAWIGTAKNMRWMTDRGALLSLADEARYDWGAAWTEDSWDGIDRLFSRLDRLAEEHGFSVGVVGFPVAFQVAAAFNEDRPQRLLAKTVARHGYPFLDLLPVLRPMRTERLFFDVCHPNEAANARIGQEVAAFIGREMMARPGSAED